MPPGRAPAQIADITEQASQGDRRDHRRWCTTSAPGKGTVGKLMTDDRLYTELQRFVATAGEMTREHPAGPRHGRQAAERSEDGRTRSKRR